MCVENKAKFFFAFLAVAVAHGATGKGNDQVRFELTMNALGKQKTRYLHELI